MEVLQMDRPESGKSRSGPVMHIVLFVILFPATISCYAQEDSTQLLEEATVKVFGQNRNLATAAVRSFEYPPASNKTSFVAGLNAIPGIRMEERSPGSYRINIRGSSLRSPFGVRNVKVYWNNIPVTDPGGNTYFNQFAFNNFTRIDVIKGPASSMYGTGTGGLILIDHTALPEHSADLEYITGSYSLQNILVTANVASNDIRSKITYAHTQSRGYREQSALRKDNFSWTGNVKLPAAQRFSASVLFTDLYYQTPGGLTLTEYETNPGAARPATGSLPSAAEAKSAIFQKTILGGITYTNNFSSLLNNTTTVYGAYADVKNSAIRNYESRQEPHFGGRTVFNGGKKIANRDSVSWHAGIEWQQGYFKISVNGNKNGEPDTLQTRDAINNNSYNIFAQLIYSMQNHWFFTAGASVNKNRLQFRRLNDDPVRRQIFSFSNEIAPRFSVSKKWNFDFFLLGAVAKGFSPPGIAELLPSTGTINTALQPERGWNYEITARQYLLDHRFLFEATAFYFDLANALVQRRDSSGADYFTNAGSLHQKGLELYAGYLLTAKHGRFFDYADFKTGYSYSRFRYGRFLSNQGDFSGNTIPGVPASGISFLADLYTKPGPYLNATYYGVSKIFLNDANTAIATAYHLLGLKMGYKATLKNIQLGVYIGADNLMNEKYSLGNDINAISGRYYNAAPRRNYYAGAVIEFKRR